MKKRISLILSKDIMLADISLVAFLTNIKYGLKRWAYDLEYKISMRNKIEIKKSIIIRYITCFLFDNKKENEIKKTIDIKVAKKLYPIVNILREYNEAKRRHDFIPIDIHIKSIVFDI